MEGSKNAERAYLLQQPGCPFEITGVVVEWAELEQSGKAVDLHGEIELVPKFSTTFIIAAVGQVGEEHHRPCREQESASHHQGKDLEPLR